MSKISIGKELGAGAGGRDRHAEQKSVFKKQIPLLKIMRDLPVDEQLILLHHLDSKACKNIVVCIKKVLAGTHLSKSSKQKLIKELGPYRDLMRSIVASKKRKESKDLLPYIGGGLSAILASAIPILIEIARRKKWI